MQIKNFSEVTRELQTHLVSYLEERGIDTKKKFSCLNPKHEDSNPSCSIIPGGVRAFCYGCLEASELIWTSTGLKAIGDIKVGEKVLDYNGIYSEVTNVTFKTDTLLAIETSNFRHSPLKLTSNHLCFYIKKEVAIANLPYLHNRHNSNLTSVGWKAEHKIPIYNRSYKYKKNLEFSIGEAKDVNVDDFILFPVIKNRKLPILENNEIIKPYTKGPKNPRITGLPVNINTARFYGLYLAEGSTGPRHITFTFHINEKDTLAKFIIDTANKEFSLYSNLVLRKEHNTCEVTISSTDLARQLEFWFGKGAANKKIPIGFISAPSDIQWALLNGYLDGDGTKVDNSATTISEKLALNIFNLSIQLELLTSFSRKEAYIDKTGLSHQPSFRIGFKKLEGINGFYETINNQNYYWSRVISNKSYSTEEKNVVDISVLGSNTFTTKLGLVHNCNEAFDIFDAVRILEKKAAHGPAFITDVLQYLAEKYKVVLEMGEVSEDKIYELSTYRAYKAAADYIGSQALNKMAEKEVKRRKWSKETLTSTNTGCVPSYQGFIEYLHNSGYTDDKFLEDCDLTRSDIFNEHNLIFTIADEYGHPVGFAARNLLFKKDDPSTGSKYINQRTTGIKCNIYQKGKRLYGFNLAKDEPGTIYVFEGQGDVITAREAGLLNCCAIGSTALTTDHILLLKEFNKFNITLCLDGDKPGQDRIEKLLDTRFAGHKDMRVSIVRIPDGLDPDDFIRDHSIEDFRNLAKWSAFEWRLERFSDRSDPGEISKAMIPFIINEPSYLAQEDMCKVLARVTGYSLKAISSEVERMQNAHQERKNSERKVIVERALKDVLDNPDDAETTLSSARDQLFQIAKKYDEDYMSEEACLKEIVSQRQLEESKSDKFSGFALGADLLNFQEALSGEWNKDVLMVFGGKANTGKCVSEDTRILDPVTGTYNSIKQIYNNKTANIYTISDSKLLVTKPSLFYNGGIKETITITNALGYEITGTLEHPLLTLDGWKKMKDIKITDTIAMVKGYNLNLSQVDVSNEYIRLMAYYLTEGSCSLDHGSTPGFTTASQEIANDFQYCITSVFSDLVKIRKDVSSNRCPTYSVSHEIKTLIPFRLKVTKKLWNKRNELNLTRKQLADLANTKEYNIVSLEHNGCLLEEADLSRILDILKVKLTRLEYWAIGYANPVIGFLKEVELSGKLSKEKAVPSIVFSFNNKQLALFLSIVWDCDGSYPIRNNKNRDCSIEIGTASKQLNKDIQHLLLRLNIPSNLRYKPVKLNGKIFNSWITKIGSAKYMKLFLELTSSLCKNEARTFINNKKLSNKTYYGIQSEQEDLLYLKIRSIENTGQKQVYDLTVEDTHNFIANDIVVHNTAFLSKLAYEIASHEQNDALVIYHTIDDTAEQLIPRLVAIAEGSRSLSINQIKDPNYWSKQEGSSILHKRTQGYDSVEHLVKNGRMIIKDANHGTTLAYLETLLAYYKEKYPQRNIVYFLDNFHKLTDFGGASDNERVRFKNLSKSIKGLATRYHVPILCTMEYTKLAAGTRPGNNNIAETVSMEYDSNFIAHMYNELHELGPQATSYHILVKDNQPVRMPRIEMIIGKNKISSFKNSLYYDFYPSSSDFIAIDEDVIANELAAAKEEKDAANKKKGFSNPKEGGLYS